MVKKIKTFLCACIIMVMLPFVVTMIFQKDILFHKEKNGESVMEEMNSEQQLLFDDDLEGKVIAILAKQISVNSNVEAIKAQAVIVRTNVIGSKLSNKPEPEGMTTDQMMKLFGDASFTRCYEKLSRCVQETAGLIMVSNNRPIEASYFAISAGATRSAKDAFGEKDIPYLIKTESKQDIEADDFLCVKSIPIQDFVKQCKDSYPECEITQEDLGNQIEIKSRDESEYVNEIRIGKTTVSGEDFRNKMGLNSACFTWKEVEGKVRIVTKGLGHGVGLSQYGAEELAESGKEYQYILKRYYSGVDIISYDDNYEETTEN